MIGAVLLPISIFAAVALQTLLRAEREAALQTLGQTATATALLVDRELSSAESALRVLARSPHLAHGDLRGFYEHARTADRGDGGRTILFDASGQQIINTVIPLGDPLPPPPDYVRLRTRQVIDTQHTVVSGLIKGAVQQIPVTTINIPVPFDGGRRYVLASVFGPEYFTRLIVAQAHPASWTLAVVDGAGNLVAHSLQPTRLASWANPLLLRAARAEAQGLVRYTTRAGVDTYHAFTHSPMSGWLVAVSAPASEIESAARQAVVLAAAGMLVALLCAALAALFFGRRLVNSIDGAAHAAKALGHGSVPPEPRTGIAEVDALNRSIRDAGDKLAEAACERSGLLQREHAARLLAEDQVRIRDEFLAMLSHELRNPLSGIVGAAQLLRLDAPNPAQKRHAQEILLRQSRHLSRIVDDLLDLARLARGKVKLEMRPVELGSVVASTVDALRLAGRVRHQLTCALEPAWIRADRTRIEQVVGNLLTNATKYTPSGGSIDVVLRTTDGQAILEVGDTGVGIAPELMPRLFDIFVQGDVALDRSQGGLGIGLSLVRGLVELHGGSIAAESAGSGQGSIFRLRLPLMEGAGPAPREDSTGPHLARRTLHSVLLVDDNVDGRHMLAARLAADGYRVVEAGDGLEALEVARREKPELAIVDIGLPGLDGYQVAERLRADPALRGMRLYALTGYGQEADRVRAFEAGFDEHFVKPLSFEDLARYLAEA